MEDSLTKSEEKVAELQGWKLELIYDARGYFAFAISPTQGSALGSAHLAHMFVWEKAKLGDLVCRRALSIVASSELAGKSAKVRKKAA